MTKRSLPPSRALSSSLLALALAFALGACSSGTATTTGAPSSAGNDSQALPPKAQSWLLATYEGRYDATTGKLTLQRLPSASATARSPAGSVTPDTFGEQPHGGPGVMDFINLANSGGQANCGDPTTGIPSQPNSFCAGVELQNNASNAFSLLWVVITQIDSPVTVAMSPQLDTLPAALTGLVNQKIGALTYGDVAVGASSTREWVFQNVGTKNFTFHYHLFGAPALTGYGVTAGAPPSFVDACALPGASVWNQGNDDTHPVDGLPAPFPITIYNRTGAFYSVTPEGYMSLDPLLDSAKGANHLHTALPTATVASGGEPGATLFAYWAHLLPRIPSDPAGTAGVAANLTGSVCTFSDISGGIGHRFLDVTWKNLMLYPYDDTNVIVTARFSEADDSIELQYDMLHDLSAWPASLTSATQTTSLRTRGGAGGATPTTDGVTIGFQGTTSGPCTDANFCTQFLFNSVDSRLPAAGPSSSETYPRFVRFTPKSACLSPNTVCGAACVDTQTDAQNCGGCGSVCAGACTSGACGTVQVYSTYAFGSDFGDGTPGNASYMDACTGGASVTSATATVTLPFPFTLYSTTSATLNIATSGQLTLGSTATTPSGVAVNLPSASAPTPVFFAFWDGLKYGAGGKICYQTIGAAPNREFVIEWRSMDFAGPPDEGSSLDFEAYLYEGTNEIDTVYNAMTGAPGDTSSRESGGLAWVGMQNESATAATGELRSGGYGSGNFYKYVPSP